MKKNLLLLLLILGLSACANEKQPENNTSKETEVNNPIAPLNPNGDSELALLMRKMEAQWKETKKSIESGQTATDIPDFANLLTATPTDESMTGEAFNGYAQSYLNQIKALQKAHGDQKEAYNNVVNGCILCHENSCSGPLPRIKRLLIKG